MKHILSFALIITLVGAVHAQSYSDAFDRAFSRDDVDGQRKALATWQREAPTDVNLYIAWYNFYANLAVQQLPDGSSKVSDTGWADSALSAIDAGIRQYPDRLDMWFGKIFFLGELTRWDAFADVIMQMLDHSQSIDNRWEYPNVNEGLEELVCEALSDYQYTMLYTVPDWFSPTDDGKAIMRRVRRVGHRAVQLFPSDVSSIYTLAVSYIFEDTERAIKYLQRAETLAPSNETIHNMLEEVRKRAR